MRTSDRNTATSFRKALIRAPIGPVSNGHRDPFRLIWTALFLSRPFFEQTPNWQRRADSTLPAKPSSPRALKRPKGTYLLNAWQGGHRKSVAEASARLSG